MKNKLGHRKHIHIMCNFCGWQKCPGENDTVALSGFYLVHVVDEHWDVVERIHGSTGFPELRRQVIKQIGAELLS